MEAQEVQVEGELLCRRILTQSRNSSLGTAKSTSIASKQPSNLEELESSINWGRRFRTQKHRCQDWSWHVVFSYYSSYGVSKGYVQWARAPYNYLHFYHSLMPVSPFSSMAFDKRFTGHQKNSSQQAATTHAKNSSSTQHYSN